MYPRFCHLLRRYPVASGTVGALRKPRSDWMGHGLTRTYTDQAKRRKPPRSGRRHSQHPHLSASPLEVLELEDRDLLQQ